MEGINCMRKYKQAAVFDSQLFLDKCGDEIYDVAKSIGGLCIDGGAGAGFVTKQLLQNKSTHVLAFEPFPGNWPFFKKNIGETDRVEFFCSALGSFTGKGFFYNKRTVDKNVKGWESMCGYSSEGCLVSAEFAQSIKDSGKLFEVDVTRLQDLKIQEITLLKLDLQGGEYDALIGLGNEIQFVKIAYVEFTLDYRTLNYFIDNNFVVFDTLYTGIPKKPMSDIIPLFESYEIINLSNGWPAISGVIRGLPRDAYSYIEFLSVFKEANFHHLWTDLIAVNKNFLRDFLNIAISVNRG